MEYTDNAAGELDRKWREDPAFRSKVEAALAENMARLALPPQEAPLEAAAAQQQQVITFEALWWGYRITVPQAAMKDFEQGGKVVERFMLLGGAAIAATGPMGAIAAAAVKLYITAELAAMKLVNKGKGVYLSASWAAPTIIIPTTIL